MQTKDSYQLQMQVWVYLLLQHTTQPPALCGKNNKVVGVPLLPVG
jgi:hypothetical protein